MNDTAVCNAIIARLNADTTPTVGYAALVLGGTRQLTGPLRSSGIASTSYPYVVVWVSSNGNPQHAQKWSDGFECEVNVTIVDESNRGVARIQPIIARAYGDASLSLANAGVPTYGLHRHKLVLGADANGWASTVLVCYGGAYSVDEDESIFSHTTTYKVSVSRYPT